MKRTPLARKAPLKGAASLQRKTPLRAIPTGQALRPVAKALGGVAWPKLTPGPSGRLVAAAGVRTRENAKARTVWTRKRYGTCMACGAYARIVRHHVVDRQIIAKAGGDVWDLRNALDLCAPLPWGGACTAHADHHSGGGGRLPMSLVSVEARAFAVEVLGEGPAAEFFRRRYR